MQTFEQAVEKVVNWWSDNSFKIVINQDNGDDSNGGLAFLLMNSLSIRSRQEVAPEKIEKFKESLTLRLLTANDYYRYNLGVDYGADQPLIDACKDAEISVDCLPIKSDTWIDYNNNEVEVRLGYSGKRKTI